MADVSEMDAMEKVGFVRSTVTPLDLADMFELEVWGDKIRSPWNESDHTPSCHLYEDGFFDYSTGRHGDVIDLFMKLTGKTWGQSVNKLAAGAERMDADPDRVRRVPRELPDLTEQWYTLPELNGIQAAVWAPVLDPVTPKTLTGLGMWEALRGDFDHLYIAHWHQGAVRGIKIRTWQNSKSAVPGSTFACGLYSPLTFSAIVDKLIITEGESDCWALLQAGLDCACMGLPSGAALWRDGWLADLEQYKTIYTAFDNDRAGKQATEKVRSAVGWGRWRELKVPDLFNDVREAMAAGWEPKL